MEELIVTSVLLVVAAVLRCCGYLMVGVMEVTGAGVVSWGN